VFGRAQVEIEETAMVAAIGVPVQFPRHCWHGFCERFKAARIVFEGKGSCHPAPGKPGEEPTEA